MSCPLNGSIQIRSISPKTALHTHVPLNRVGLGENAVAVEDGRIVELRLSDVPLTRPEGITRLTALQGLWLSGNRLSSLPDLTPL